MAEYTTECLTTSFNHPFAGRPRCPSLCRFPRGITWRRSVFHGAGVYSMSTDITLDAQQAVLPEDGGAVMTGR